MAFQYSKRLVCAKRLYLAAGVLIIMLVGLPPCFGQSETAQPQTAEEAARDLFIRAEEKFTQKNYTQAEDLYLGAMTSFKKAKESLRQGEYDYHSGQMAEAWRKVGDCQMALGKTREAEASYIESLKLNKYGDAITSLNLLYRKTRQAGKLANLYLDQSPNNTETNPHLWTPMGETEKEIAVITKTDHWPQLHAEYCKGWIERFAGKHPEIYEYQVALDGVIDFELSRKSYDKALPYLERRMKTREYLDGNWEFFGPRAEQLLLCYQKLGMTAEEARLNGVWKARKGAAEEQEKRILIVLSSDPQWTAKLAAAGALSGDSALACMKQLVPDKQSEFAELLSKAHGDADDGQYNAAEKELAQAKKVHKTYALVEKDRLFQALEETTDYCQKNRQGRKESTKAKAKPSYSAGVSYTEPTALGYCNRGVVFGVSGQPEKALADFNKALSLEPDNVMALNNRGLTYLKQNEYQKAIDDYTRALALKPDVGVLYGSRGSAYLGLKQYDKGIADCTKFISLAPQDAGAYNNRAWGYAHIGELQKALQDVEASIKINPHNSAALTTRAYINLQSQKFEAVITDCTQALRINGKEGSAYYYRAKAYEQLGNKESAKKDMGLATELHYTPE